MERWGDGEAKRFVVTGESGGEVWRVSERDREQVARAALGGISRDWHVSKQRMQLESGCIQSSGRGNQSTRSNWLPLPLLLLLWRPR